MSRSGESRLPGTQKKTSNEDAPERKVREWVAKGDKTMNLRGEKRRIQGDCVGHLAQYFCRGWWMARHDGTDGKARG
jgi:hypothetical protein